MSRLSVGLLVAARHVAVAGAQAALLVVVGAFVRFAAGLPQGVVRALEKGVEKPSPEARFRTGRGSFAMWFGVHMFDVSFGGLR